MAKILVTGGCGYIGSHCIVELLQQGHKVLSIDNYSRSRPEAMENIERITGEKVHNYAVDLCNMDETVAVFTENPDVEGIIHFAAYKEVGESEDKPLLYYHNNLNALINILQCAVDFEVPQFIFSSSCTVYGNPDAACVTEDTVWKPAASSYGATKQMGEEIVASTVNRYPFMKAALLRYFNPVGAHPSLLIGELPKGRPANLVPAITQAAIGKIKDFTVHGTDYNTKDGSCLRDFIHVSDIARAHVNAFDFLQNNTQEERNHIYNLGTGNGVTVLELIQAFEKVNAVKLDYKTGDRRPGDVEAIYANNQKARQDLHWEPLYGLEEMMRTAWEWEKKMG